MADTPKHSVSVAGIVVDDQDRVLVIQRRDNGRWEPPGGVLELEETPEDGAYREVLEETGVEVQVGRLTGVYKNVSRGVVALVFRCSPIAGRPVSTPESVRACWMPKNELSGSIENVYLLRILDAFADEPIVRSHDGTSFFTVPVSDRASG